MAQTDIGIDLGTTTIIIAQAGQGVVLNQPSVVAVDTRKNSVLEVGDKALAMVGRTPNYISAIFPLKDGVIKLYLDDVKYVEVFRHRIIYHTFEGVTEVRGTMRDTAALLSDKGFAQCNSCWLVNMRYVTEVRGSTIKVAGDELIVSRNKRREFLDRLAMYMAGERKC